MDTRVSGMEGQDMLQALEEPHAKAGGCLKGGYDPVGDLWGEERTLEQPVL